MWLADARLYQICFLSIFLLVGITTRDWSLRPGMIFTAIATCLFTQTVFFALSDRESHSSVEPVSPPEANTSVDLKSLTSRLLNGVPSALITGLGLSLLLRTDHYSTMILAGGGAIASKFWLRMQNKHLFNPANFGIVIALTLTQDAWVSPGQWGEESWYAILFLSAGGLVLQRVGRWDTSIAFLGAYAGLEAIRNLWLGWSWDVWAHRLMSGSLLLFALFMVTDPRTIPNTRIGRLIWAIAIALLTFVLRNYFFLSTAVFWSLFALAPLGWLLDWILPADRFEWQGRSPESQTHTTQAAIVEEAFCKP